MRLAISMKLIWHKSEEMSNQPYWFNPFDRGIFKSFRSSYIFFDSRQLTVYSYIICKARRKGTRRFISVQTLESQHKLTRDRVIYASGPAHQFRLQKGKNTLLIEQEIFDWIKIRIIKNRKENLWRWNCPALDYFGFWIENLSKTLNANHECLLFNFFYSVLFLTL